MKKETKKTSKKTIKVEPKFIVDLTGVETVADMYAAFGYAKQRAGLSMTDAQFTAILNKIVDEVLAATVLSITESGVSMEINGDEKLVFDSKGNVTIKKPNIFKRFWNWITRKK